MFNISDARTKQRERRNR